MRISNLTRRLVGLAGVGLMALGMALAAAPAGAAQIAYFPDLHGTRPALLIDWQVETARARVVNSLGAQSGAVTGDATQPQRRVTLDSPFSQFYLTTDLACGVQQAQQRKDTHAIQVDDVSGGADTGTSQVFEFGAVTTLDGCNAGLVQPYFSSTTMNRVAMNARPSVRDLTPGTMVAGFSEYASLPGLDFLRADVVTLYAGGTASFAATANVVPAAFNAEQWLVFTFGSFERAYTRLAVDKTSGAETWLRAEWSGGQAQRVIADLVIKFAASAGFGTERQAARMWESGLFRNSQQQFFIYLYQGGTGARVSKDLATGTESRVPITWAFYGKDIVQTRFVGTVRRDRAWVPLRNIGGNIRFVMESETATLSDGTIQPIILPRVTFYVDTGKAVPP